MSWNAHTDHIFNQLPGQLAYLCLAGPDGSKWGESGNSSCAAQVSNISISFQRTGHCHFWSVTYRPKASKCMSHILILNAHQIFHCTCCTRSKCVMGFAQTIFLPLCLSYTIFFKEMSQQWRAEVESRTQGSRPRTQRKSEAKAKDSLSEDRHSRGHGQECSRPRTQAQVLSKKKKKGLHRNFSGDLQNKKKKEKVFTKIFQAISKEKKRSSQKFFKRSPQKNVF